MNQDRRVFLRNSLGAGGLALMAGSLGPIKPAQAQSGEGRELATRSIAELSHLLEERKITSRQLVEQALTAIKDTQIGRAHV